MNIISMALKRPMAVVAGVFMIVVLGLAAMRTIPIQLTPDVARPILAVYTYWRGVAPVEVEREITNKIEQELAGIEGLEEISSQSQLGRSRIVLEFNVEQNMDRAFMLVSNRLNGVSNLPDEATATLRKFAQGRLDALEPGVAPTPARPSGGHTRREPPTLGYDGPTAPRWPCGGSCRPCRTDPGAPILRHGPLGTRARSSVAGLPGPSRVRAYGVPCVTYLSVIDDLRRSPASA